MIAVVVRFQGLVGFFDCHTVCFSQIRDPFAEILMKLRLCYAADCRIFRIHRDVHYIVQAAEHVHLRQFADTGQHDETQVGVLRLHDTVEAAQNLAVVLFEPPVAENVEDRLVVFVDKHDDLTARLFYRPLDKLAEHLIGGKLPIYLNLKLIGPFQKSSTEVARQYLGIFYVVASVEVDMKHRVAGPLTRFESVDGQSFE